MGQGRKHAKGEMEVGTCRLSWGKTWIMSLRSRLRRSARHMGAALDRGCAIGRWSRPIPGIRVPFLPDLMYTTDLPVLLSFPDKHISYSTC